MGFVEKRLPLARDPARFNVVTRLRILVVGCDQRERLAEWNCEDPCGLRLVEAAK
jgi:hypothetical protein